MSSTNKTSLGLNIWEASDKPVRQDFVNDNTIIDEKITKINSNLDNVNSNLSNTSSVTVTAPSGFGGTVNVELIKTGNQVDCRITVNNSGDIPSVTAITNVITEAYRPKTQVFIVLRKNNSDSTAAVMYSNTINAIRSTDQPISAGTWYGFAHWSTATY
jgi:hypothetical protein